MNKQSIIPILVLVGLLLACFSATVNAMGFPSSVKDELTIPIRAGNPPVDPNSPRSPGIIPVSCSFNDVTGYLNFTFLFPMGDVTITLTEASAGVVSTDEYSTSTCSVVIHVPSQGTYEISILLESGMEYTGQFIL